MGLLFSQALASISAILMQRVTKPVHRQLKDVLILILHLNIVHNFDENGFFIGIMVMFGIDKVETN